MVEHVDPEVLALVALAEPAAEDAARSHIATCATCSGEVASLARAVAVGRTLTAADAVQSPPASVWSGIRSELGLSAALRPDGATITATDAGPLDGSADVEPGRAERRTGPTGLGRLSTRGPAALGGVTRPGRRAPWIIAAAAAGVVVGGAGGSWWVSSTQDEAPAVLAEATLDPLPGWEAIGEAVVEENADGSRVLVLSLEGEQPGGGFREVWLIDREVTRLVSLGVLDGSSGRFTVPAGLDLTDFAVVDVSEEPLDGDPAHSGDSIIRGILDA